MVNGREKDYRSSARPGQAVGKWYPSSDQGKIP